MGSISLPMAAFVSRCVMESLQDESHVTQVRLQEGSQPFPAVTSLLEPRPPTAVLSKTPAESCCCWTPTWGLRLLGCLQTVACV